MRLLPLLLAFAISFASARAEFRAAVVKAVGAPAESFWRVDIAPFSVTTLRGSLGRWNLVELAKRASVDDVEHHGDHNATT